MATQMIKGANRRGTLTSSLSRHWRSVACHPTNSNTPFEVLKWPVHGVSCTTIQAMYPLRKSHLMDNT